MRRRRKKADRAADAADWMKKTVRSAPRPLPPGCFPRILAEAEDAGFSREETLNVLDEWLNFGYCRIADHITQDIDVTFAGEMFFYG
ncbi:MAG: hypothetical protein IKS68_04560 [Mailhella sp.]|nr:hypothetical protein [Mailhella sp.]